MAKGLKPGDAVTVRKPMSVSRKSEAYQQGLKRLRPGQIGKIVEMVEKARSVIVDFDGKQVKLASQRLERPSTPASVEREGAPEGARRGRRKQVAGAAGAQQIAEDASLIDYKNPNLVKTVANKLLTSGGLQAGSEAVVVQIKLSDLPEELQQQVKNLLNAKLALGPRSDTASGQQPKRRGRKPKKSQA